MASSEATTATTIQALVVQKANLVTTRGLRKPRLIFESLNRRFESRRAQRSNRGFRRAPQFVRAAFLRLPRRDPDRDCNCEHRGICPLRSSARCETEATSMDQRTK